MNKINKKGFTIIEVVLVLAIAGLIFVVVFLAVPQLQSSRRDTQRRNDAGRVLAEIQNWAANSNGNLPTNFADGDAFYDQFIEPLDLRDPSTGELYTLGVDDPVLDATAGTARMQIANGMLCGDENGNLIPGASRDASVRVTLDNQATFYCIDIGG